MAVTTADYGDQLKSLDSTMRNIEAVLDLDRLRKDKAELEAAAAAPDLWDDQARAQQVTSRLSFLASEINRVERLRGSLDEVGTEVAALTKSVDELEVRTLLSGDYDAREALVTIRSGAGGVDAADFAE